MPTDFPKKGDDKKISLFNSNYPQFDYDYASNLKSDYPDIWRKGGNIRGNEAFNNWSKARKGTETPAVLDWIKEREAWAARHYRNNRVAGVVAQIKWGVIGSRGEGYMKELINEEKNKQKERSVWQRITDYIKSELGLIQRRIKDVESWDGSPSRWPDTASYCDACLINLNTGPREDWTQSNCKLPVREPGDNQDTFVRQAVYAAAAFFNRVDAPDNALAAAKESLLEAYEEMDEEPPESLTRAMSYSQLSEQVFNHFMMQGNSDYPIDIYMDDTEHYLLTTSQGKLYRYPIQLGEGKVALGQRQQVMESHTPVSTRTIIRQTANNQKRWVSISATSVLNRDGEIDSRDLFDSFIEYAESTGEYPVRMFYHSGEKFIIGKADFLARDENCYITSGLFDDTELGRRAAKALEQNPDYWGESIGYLPTSQPELFEVERGIKIPVYKSGVNIEISQLPEAEAANLFTVTKGVDRMLNDNQKQAFYKLFDGDEEAAETWLEENAATRNQKIKEEGMITRSKEEDVKEPVEPQSGNVVIDDSVIDAIVNRVQSGNAQLVETFKGEFDAIKSDLQVAREQIASLQNDKTRMQATLDILKAEYDEKVQQRQADTRTTETRVIYKPRATKEADEEPQSYAKLAESRLPKIAY